MNTSYSTFLNNKRRVSAASGIKVDSIAASEKLFEFQRDIVKWACNRGRAAIFADCGLGKTFMQLEWLRMLGGGLIVAPLSVTHQTKREAIKMGVPLDNIQIVNYENIHKVDTYDLHAVVLDESSILKNSAGKVRTRLIEAFQHVPYRLACSATPSPNDHEELTNHAAFLGIATRVEVLANYFVHDQDGWRLKRHGEIAFYDWVATWAVSCRKPSDLGYDDDGFHLPILSITPAIVSSPRVDGSLFGGDLVGITGRSRERRATMEARITRAVDIANATTDQVIIWCGLNDESREASSRVDGAVEITGSMSCDEKESRLLRFINGLDRVLITKPKIGGFGLNLQNAATQVFLGISDSYEAYYQCIRRSWRFGQTRPVHVYIVHSEAEGAIVENVQRKEDESVRMADALIERCAIHSGVGRWKAGADRMQVEPSYMEKSGANWHMTNADCIDVMRAMPRESIDFSIYSPPFASLYTYSDSPNDMGNCSSLEEFKEHFQFFPPELLRVTKCGRLTAVHCSQIASTLQVHGVIGIIDFRGLLINLFKDAGWIHHGEVTVDKCPQVQAIRTKSKSLLFVQKEKDASWLRPGLADYILLFRAPGENVTPIREDDVSREDWIDWARPVWYGIRESKTLNVVEARGTNDERHICPLQLDLIKRAVMLWSNKGELVFSPFAGIGSEGYVAIEEDRRFRGVELKSEYFSVACKNLGNAERGKDQLELFNEPESEQKNDG